MEGLDLWHADDAFCVERENILKALRWRKQVTRVNVNWLVARYWKRFFVLENLVGYMYSKCRYCLSFLDDYA